MNDLATRFHKHTEEDHYHHFEVGKADEKPLELPYRGEIGNPDGHGRITGKCGDTIEIFLKFENGRVDKASFKTSGCRHSAMCGSTAASLALGKSPDQIIEITGEMISQRTKELPNAEEHCAFLAAETLQEALNSFMQKQRRNSRKIRRSNHSGAS
jgi:nitrogen fixation NifU-like protein